MIDKGYIDKFSVMNLSYTIWSFAALDIQPSKRFKDAWFRRVVDEKVIGKFTGDCLANCFWAFAKLGEMNQKFFEIWESIVVTDSVLLISR